MQQSNTTPPHPNQQTSNSMNESQKESFVQRSLFGGAIECILPLRFADVAEVRQVPDNQEVFADANTDQSIIVEILEHHDVPNSEAAAYHFADIAQANDAQDSSQILSVETVPHEQMPHLPAGTFAQVLLGQQLVAKFNEREYAKNDIHLYLVVVRLPHQETDILITLNEPVYIAPASSSMKTTTHIDRESINSSLAIIKVVLASFNIKDWSLFN